MKSPPHPRSRATGRKTASSSAVDDNTSFSITRLAALTRDIIPGQTPGTKQTLAYRRGGLTRRAERTATGCEGWSNP